MLVVAGATQPGPVRAAESDWTSIGPTGGTVTAFATDPGAPAIVYAGTEAGGVYKSTDAGASWARASSGISIRRSFGGQQYVGYGRITALAVDPSGGGHVYAATNRGELFRSDDDGGTWTLVLDLGNSRAVRPAVRTLAVDPVRPGTVYALVLDDDIGRVLASDDDFATTRTVDCCDTFPSSLAVDPAGLLVVGTLGSGVEISADAGVTFTPAATPGSGTVTALTADPDSGDLYANAGGNAYVSDDGGAAWDAVPALDGLRAMAFPATGGPYALVLATIYRLDTTWDVVAGSPDAGAIGLSGGTLLAGTDLGVQRRPAAGSFAAANAGLDAVQVGELVADPDDADRLWAREQGGNRVLRSANGGTTWQSSTAGTGIVRDLELDPFDPAVIYVATSDGVMRSGDSGATWAPFGPAKGGSVSASQKVEGRVYAVAGSSGLRRTTDGGATWQVVPGPWAGGGVSDVVLVPTFSETVLVSSGAGLYRSIDRGAHWARVQAAGGNIVWQPGHPGHLLLKNGVDLRESETGGATWTDISGRVPFAGLGVPAFDVVSPNIAYLPSADPKRDHALYRTTDGGLHWPLWEPLVGAQQVRGVAVSGDMLFATGYGSGVYQRSVADLILPGVDVAPRPGFVVGSTVTASQVPVRVGWHGVDRQSGIASYDLQEKKDLAGVYTDVPVTPPSATSVVRSLEPTFPYQWQVRATDNAGNQSAFRIGQRRYLALVGDGTPTVTYKGSWATPDSSRSLGGQTHQSTAMGASVSYHFSGSAFGWVSPVGTLKGRAAVYVDGVRVATVDLHAAAFAPRRVVFQRTWSEALEHTVKIVALGQHAVNVDAFTIMR
jgi:hypothetical protein